MSQTEARDYIIGYFAERGLTVQPGATFADVQMDSLGLVEFIMHLEEKFGIDINADEIDAAGNIGQFFALVDRALEARQRTKRPDIQA